MRIFYTSILITLFVGCAVYEPLPGLCYTDKTGTYLCPEETTIEDYPEVDEMGVSLNGEIEDGIFE